MLFVTDEGLHHARFYLSESDLLILDLDLDWVLVLADFSSNPLPSWELPACLEAQATPLMTHNRLLNKFMLNCSEHLNSQDVNGCY